MYLYPNRSRATANHSALTPPLHITLVRFVASQMKSISLISRAEFFGCPRGPPERLFAQLDLRLPSSPPIRHILFSYHIYTHYGSEGGYFGRDGIPKRESSRQTHLAR